MRLLAYFWLTMLALFACSTLPFSPKHTGVDTELSNYVYDYQELARINGIKFGREVNMGFREINDGSIIGLCTYSLTFREITVDSLYWRHASEISRMALMYHELTHCYCTRSHDFAEDKEYPATPEDRLNAMPPHGKAGNGYLEDGCPSTLMYPVILDDTCTILHYNHYIQEMFERCDAY